VGAPIKFHITSLAWSGALFAVVSVLADTPATLIGALPTLPCSATTHAASAIGPQEARTAGSSGCICAMRQIGVYVVAKDYPAGACGGGSGGNPLRRRSSERCADSRSWYCCSQETACRGSSDCAPKLAW